MPVFDPLDFQDDQQHECDGDEDAEQDKGADLARRDLISIFIIIWHISVALVIASDILSIFCMLSAPCIPCMPGAVCEAASCCGGADGCCATASEFSKARPTTNRNSLNCGFMRILLIVACNGSSWEPLGRSTSPRTSPARTRATAASTDRPPATKDLAHPIATDRCCSRRRVVRDPESPEREGESPKHLNASCSRKVAGRSLPDRRRWRWNE